MAKAAKAFGKTNRTFNFEKAVAEAYRQHPEVADTVFFIDADKGKLVHPDPAIRARLVSAVNANDSMRSDLNLEIEKHKMQKASSVMQLRHGKQEVYFVFLYLQKDMQSALGEKHNLDENMQLVFDHEFAHALIPQAHGAKLLSESTADAYAALRHFQRNGTGTGTIEKLMKRRAALGFMIHDDEHFTPPALEKVLSVKNDFNFSALTPQQTVALAATLAKAGTMKKDNIRRLARHFSKFTKPMRNPRDDKPLRLLAETVLAARSPDLKKWGVIALRAFLDKDIALKVGGKKVKMDGPYWNNVRRRLRNG